MLSDARRKEKQDELNAKFTELGQFEREIWGPNGKVAQMNEQLTRPIITKIKEVVEKIAAAEAFSIIFDAADGNLVFGEPALDLTDRILAELNATDSSNPRR
jgi:outer membrane protein